MCPNFGSRASILATNPPAPLLRLGASVFAGKNFFLEPPWSRSVLAALLLGSLLFFEAGRTALRLDAIAQFHSGQIAVRGLGALPLAPHLDPGGLMPEDHGGGGLVDLLPARAGPADERFDQIILPNSEFFHACRQCGIHSLARHALNLPEPSRVRQLGDECGQTIQPEPFRDDPCNDY